MSDKRKSKLATAIENTPRKDHGPFDLPSGFVNPAGKDVAQVMIRVLVKVEENAALLGAHKAIKDAVYDGAEAALSDTDFTADVKGIHALYKACRDAEDPMYPAFFDQEWMAKHFTTDKIQWLLNLYLACRRKEEVMQWEVEEHFLEKKLEALAVCRDEEIADAILADCNEEWCKAALGRIASKLMSERKALWRARQLLGMSLKFARSTVGEPATARELSFWATAVSSEMAWGEQPWGTRIERDRGWIGLPRVSYAEAGAAATKLMEEAMAHAPPLSPEEETALAAELAAATAELAAATAELGPEDGEPVDGGPEAPEANSELPPGAILLEDDPDDDGGS